MTGPDWDSLLWETRGYLEVEDDAPVPKSELVETAKANGWDEREIRDAFRSTEELVAVGGDATDPMVREAGHDTVPDPATEKEDTNPSPADGSVERADPTPEEGTDDATGARSPGAGRGRDGAPEPSTEEADPNPSPEAEGSETSPERVREAFTAALEYFHNQLDSEIGDHVGECDHETCEGEEECVRPTTAREYFTEYRGWSEDAVEENLLGWAPPNTGALDALHRRGFSREEILATGLFTDDLRPLWQGRYVLPYFDGEGRPTYATARATGPEGGGAAGYDGHPADYFAGKYGKVRHTDERVPFTEPIWGKHTLEDGEPVLIAEGIADAIAAADRGYAVLSPVAKEFKRDHFGPVLDALEKYDVPRVVVVPDAERAEFGEIDDPPETAGAIRDVVSIPATSPGIGGGLRTAAYLDDHGVDVRVADLPRGGLRKNDLDEFLQVWNDTADPVLASARPPTAFPEYDAATKSKSDTRDRNGDGRTTFDDREGSGSSSSGNGSRLWDLDVGDLTGMGAGDRGKNPLGHTGDSENYFVVREGGSGDLVARDYKRADAVYNALTFLLVDAGERRIDDPQGPLSDWEVWKAWQQAKKRGDLPSDDPVPYRAILGIAREEGLCPKEDLPDGPDDTLPAHAYNAALEFVEDRVADAGRDPVSPGSDDGEEYAEDPTELEVTLEFRTAHAAAERVGPADLDAELPLDVTGDGDAWICPVTGERVERVERAVAIAEGEIDTVDDALGSDTYDRAYRTAREEYGAPVPEFVNHHTVTDDLALAHGAVEQLKCWHILDELDSEITVEDPTGDALAKIDPTWEESESGERIVAFASGLFYCFEHETVIDPLRVVALEEGLIDGEEERLAGSDYLDAYAAARERYGAPLPEISWLESDRTPDPEFTPVLPDAEELLGEFETDESALDDAREDVEELYREIATERPNDGVDLLRVLPALGKTTAVAKNATDHPALYLAPRKELMADVAEKAADHGATWMHLPVFAESDRRPSERALSAGVRRVREEDMGILRDREELLGDLEAPLDAEEEDDGDLAHVDPDAFDTLAAARRANDRAEKMREEAEDVELERATCPTANGEHGDAWRFVVNIAKELDYSPQVIHTKARALFGEELPCTHGEDAMCDYAEAWEEVRNPDAPKDLLIAHYGHGHVGSARTHYDRDGDGRVEKTPRVVALDEFPMDAYGKTFGEEFVDFATWLGCALRDDVEDRTALFGGDLWSDEFVRKWLQGDAEEIDAVGDRRELLDGMSGALEVLEEVDDLLDEYGDGRDVGVDAPAAGARTACVSSSATSRGALYAALEDVRDLHPVWDGDDLTDAMRALRDALEDAPRRSVTRRVAEEILPDLRAVRTALDAADADALGDLSAPADVGPELEEVVEDARTAFRTRRDGAEGAVRTADDVLQGGEEGCRALAVASDDGHAHPDAYLLLYGLLADGEDVEDVETNSYAFAEDAGGDGTRIKRARRGRDTVLIDREHDGAFTLTPPEFASLDGDENPVVGLDATGRERLWSLALGEEVRTRDIHDTTAERRAFLRDVMNIRVVRTTPKIKTYEGSLSNNNLDEDLALVEEIADAFGRREFSISRDRYNTLDDFGTARTTRPGVITTKTVREALEGELADHVGAIDHYGNVNGSTALAEHNLGVILGSQHFGDHVAEKWAALAGEEADTSRTTGRGVDLDYGSDVANEMLGHMREDQTLQAALRFGRDEEGAVIFAHTAALRDELPVVGEGAVARAFSNGEKAVADAAKDLAGEEFTVGDVADRVDVSKSTVRRALDTFAELGHLEKHETPNGVANAFDGFRDPGKGEVELPDVETPDTAPTSEGGGTDPGNSARKLSYTGFAWVVGVDRGGERPQPVAKATLPAPEGLAEGDPPT